MSSIISPKNSRVQDLIKEIIEIIDCLHGFKYRQNYLAPMKASYP